MGYTLTSLCWEVNEEAQSVSCSITITGIERAQVSSLQFVNNQLTVDWEHAYSQNWYFIQVHATSCTVLVRPLFNGWSCTEHAYYGYFLEISEHLLFLVGGSIPPDSLNACMSPHLSTLIGPDCSSGASSGGLNKSCILRHSKIM